jgi:hypothetical protein
MAKVLKALFIFVCLVRPALAWDGEGHMVIAQIAYNHLDSAVKAKCDALIAIPVFDANDRNSNFVTAACWADDIKSNTDAYDDSHIDDIPISLDGYPTNGVVYDPSNVVVAISQSITKLQDPTESLSNQAVALRFLLHFCGDITQPMHCATGVTTNMPTGDEGGWDFLLTGTWPRLHNLWDEGGGYLDDTIVRPLNAAGQAIVTNKANELEGLYPYSLSVGSIPDPQPWALESWGYAKTVAYVGITNGTTPTASYLTAAVATSQQRLAIGGQRLAKLLNTMYVTNAPNITAAYRTNSSFAIRWDTVPQRSYRVQWKNQLTDTNWTDLTDITANTNTALFSDPMTQTQRFYRLIVVN